MALLHWPFCAACALQLFFAGLAAAAAGQGGTDAPGKQSGKGYTADWASLDARPLPKWFDEAKFGIFIHWGLFAVPAYNEQPAEWYGWWLNGTACWIQKHCVGGDGGTAKEWHKKMYGEGFKYQQFAAGFKAKLWEPDAWAEMFKQAGARYVVLTSKHHDGFTLWPSKYSWNWNALDIGPHRDLVGDLTAAVRGKGLRMGLYHSMFEWFHPMMNEDRGTNFTTRNFPTTKTIPELREIVEKYRPDVLWSDGEWDANTDYWGSKEFLAWLYNDSPVRDTVLVNDRWGNETRLAHGDFYSGEDRQTAGATLLGHKWESAITVDSASWGYSRSATLSRFLSATDILSQLSSTIAYGGNLLLNVGPTADGIIPPIYQERLAQVGDFLKINGEAVYGTRPGKAQNETAIQGAYYTVKGELLYLTVIQAGGYWPRPGSILDLKAVRSATSVELLTVGEPFAVECGEKSLHVQCTMPSAYDAGLLSGAVNPLGFVLRLKDAIVAEIGVGVAPSTEEIHA